MASPGAKRKAEVDWHAVDEIMELRTANRILHFANKNLQKNVDDACDRENKVSKERDSMKLSLTLAQQELKVYQGKVESNSARAQSNSARAETAEKKLDSLSAGLNDIEDLAQNIQGTLLRGREGGQDRGMLGGVKGVIQVLHAVYEQLKLESSGQEGMQEQLDATARELDTGKADIAALQQRVTAAEGQREVATKQVEELLARESALQQKLKHAESQRNSATTTELRADLERALEKHAVAEGALENSKRDVAALQQRVEAAEGQRGVATRQVEELLARESALQQKLNNVERERESATTELRADLKRALDKHAVAEGELEKSRREVASLEEGVEAAVSKFQKKIQREERRMDEYETHVQDLKRHVEEIARVVECLKKAADAKAVGLRAALAQEKKMRTDLERKLEILMFTTGIVDGDLEKRSQTTEEVFRTTIVRAEEVLAEVTQSRWHQNDD